MIVTSRRAHRLTVVQGSVDEAPRLAGCSIIMGPNVQELKGENVSDEGVRERGLTEHKHSHERRYSFENCRRIVFDGSNCKKRPKQGTDSGLLPQGETNALLTS